MKTKAIETSMQPTLKHLGIWAMIVAAVLIIPFLGHWPWSITDYIVGGVLLFGAATAFELLTRKTATTKQRLIIGAGVAAVLLYVWAELAVGIFTNLGS